MYKHLLVPTDGSELSNQTISSAVAFAKDAGASITFFYAAPDFLATGEGALLLSVAPAKVSEHIAGGAHAILMKAEAAARVASVQHDSVYSVSDRPHEAIIEAARERGCDLIFMASRGPKSIGGLLLGSETLKVLMHSRIPVLVSSVSRNSMTPQMDKAIAIIQDEHRSLAAVLHALRDLPKAVERGEVASFALALQMMQYIREFPEKLHHPKEDAYLFSKLRQRTDIANEAITALEQQHADKESLNDMEAALRQYEQAGESGSATFMAAVDIYASMQWRHMSLEETVILPAAKTYLREEDWVEIADAFGKNGDPRFGKKLNEEFRVRFENLARLAQPLQRL